MSHEGIRFVHREELADLERARFTPEQVTPAAVRVNKTAGSGMEIDWKDGHRSAYTFKWLRAACPCAHCNDEREKQGRQPGEPEKAAPNPLQVYKPAPRPEEVIPVGRYAISFHWNDGHQHGIFSWEYLRAFCPCTICAAAR